MCIRDSYGTAILVNHVNNDCEPEKFIFEGNMRFAGNHAYQGGALSLISAVMSIKPNTSLIFENNTATDVGGAIYVDSNIPYFDGIDPDTLVSCFFQFPMWSNDSQNYNITFINNQAVNGGSNIYGTPIKSYCTVFNGEDGTIIRSFNRTVLDLFDFNEDNNHSSISSSPS